MKGDVSGDHQLRRFFAEALHDSLSSKMGLHHEDVEQYLCQLLIDFLHEDGIYAIRDKHGWRIESVVDMVAEGDVRLNADSFQREREVHKHIGDFLLFWTGVFPDFLQQARKQGSKDALLDPVRQGSMSYYVASTFDYGDYAREAPVLRKLSAEFEAYVFGLSLLRSELSAGGPAGWRDGFDC